MNRSLEIKTSSVEDTIKLARSIGSRLRGGECLELISDVGGGKTTFVRGLAAGAGSSDHVSSPTFTISKLYKTPRFDIVHFDFYRLQEPGIITHEIEEAVHDKTSVIVVEWSDIVAYVLPKERIQVLIKNTGTHSRDIILTYPHKLSYLLQ